MAVENGKYRPETFDEELTRLLVESSPLGLPLLQDLHDTEASMVAIKAMVADRFGLNAPGETCNINEQSHYAAIGKETVKHFRRVTAAKSELAELTSVQEEAAVELKAFLYKNKGVQLQVTRKPGSDYWAVSRETLIMPSALWPTNKPVTGEITDSSLVSSVDGWLELARVQRPLVPRIGHYLIEALDQNGKPQVDFKVVG